MNSLKNRLLISSLIVYIIFIGFTGFVLDRSFVEKAEGSLLLRLQSQLFDLERYSTPGNNNKIIVSDKFSDIRLKQPVSGHYAAISTSQEIIWSSLSNNGIKIPYNFKIKPGQRLLSKIKSNDGTNLFLLSYGSVIWLSDNQSPVLYIYSVAESDSSYKQELISFRHGLWTWLGITFILLLTTQAIILTWGFKPLIKMRNDLSDIEEGKRDYLDSNTIDEISELTSDLNTLLRNERTRQERYKNSLGDLAHSFKTPLAVIKSTISNDKFDSKISKVLQEQVDTLNNHVTYQLRRAQTAGSRSSLNKPILVEEIIDKILNALAKVYKDKNIVVTKNIQDKSLFYGDDGDLLEVLGNLLDNAHKWCKNQVTISTRQEVTEYGTLLAITVEDNGQGIEDDKKNVILKRGVRADEKTPGHGIGMSIITDIVSAYSGELEVTDSVLGGAKFEVVFKH